MALTKARYGKGRVRVLRLARESARHAVRELTLTVLLEGDFGAAWTAGDNRQVIATDSIKNIVNVTAAQYVEAETEAFVGHVAALFLERYAQVAAVTIEALETRWLRRTVDGVPHAHTFTLDGNGAPFVRLVADRTGAVLQSGLRGYTLMKTTESGWADFVDDAFRTLPDTHDRICATSMDATWTWTAPPTDPVATNATVLDTLITVFATTYSAGVQDSMYRMGEAVLAARPDIAEIHFAMPNKHYLPMNLAPFGIAHGGQVFLPTDEPHGQIEATLTRGA
ncbi:MULTISPECIES: factor-independent urate hydroxylase [unclassified Methylobacterium]|jgi:urate oxidase|uniref:factor-independent urate hydroxylase n=1 Tax=unclassified Methylobacterium TaxID=2615210 RepID=UPI0006F85A64|nr:MULTISPECIES: urate oxidase [unclassified Methylobacterium]KQO78791.1 urate oxidase [Methylobacterium sp. Leaf88]KQP73760.1 urate oxidase [Methylobacterium sp. Leaf111]KQT83216.1 urate oxidase [Methylobacterium sp. Leaf465]